MLLVSVIAWSQTERGSIRGTVTDPTGAVVPGAALTVTNVGTGVSSTVVSSSGGTYNFPELPSGVYRIEVKQAGFKNLIRENIQVSLGSVIGLDLPLEVGSTADTVTVSAEAPMLQTETSSTGTTVENRAFVDLPLSSGGGRRSSNFLVLVPGYAGSPGGFSDSINGGQTSTKDMQIDGASTIIGEVGGDGRNVTFAPDSVQEMSVATSGYAAEYGTSGGGVERYVLKSGTNTIHGSGYEFLRNEAFDARNWFATNRPVAKHREHEFGGTIGGPIFIPKVYDGRNRSFFFFSYDGYRIKTADQDTILSVPTQAFRNGDLSAWPQPIYDPNTTALVGSTFTRQAFAGNQIPANRIDATAKKILAQIPLPNLPGTFNNYQASTPPAKNDKNTYTIKGDEYFTPSHHLSLSLVTTSNPTLSTSALPLPAGGTQIGLFTYWFPRVTYDWTISPTMLNQIRVGFNRQTQFMDSPVRSENWPAQLGLTGMEGAVGGFPNISWGSFAGTGLSNGYNDRYSNTYLLGDALSWTKGTHNLKFGFEGRRIQTLKYLGNWTGLSFSRNETANPASSATRANTGLEFASFLLGQVDQAILPLYGNFAPQFNSYQYGLYAQDDFKVTPRLTINYGLRLDIFTPTSEVHNWYSMVDLTRPNPAAGNLPGVYVWAGQPGIGHTLPGASKILKNFGPRIGLAYKINNKTVVRTGYGVSYFQSGAYGGGGPNTALNDGYWITSTSRSLNQGVTPAYIFANGFPAADRVTPPFINPALGVGTGLANYWSPTAERASQMQNWNLNIQRELMSNLTIDVGYVGSKGTYLPARTDINQLDPKYFSLGSTLLNSDINSTAVVNAGFKPPYPGFKGPLAQALRPYPQFPNLFPGGRSSDNTGNSTYHSLQASLQKRFSHGLAGTVAYTFSKSLSDAPNNFVSNAVVNLNIYDRNLTKAVTSLDRPHSLSGSFNYELPFGPGRMLANGGGPLGKIIGGWQVNGILTYRSGAHLGISAPQTNPLYDGAVALNLGSGSPIPQTADLVPGVPMKGFSGDFNPRTDVYLNKAAFKLPAGPFGTTKVLISDLRGFAPYNEDLSLVKKTALTERVSLDLRFEAFNAFNRVVFGNPSTNYGNLSTFGKVTSASTARNGQVVAKITF
jgi:hypothetical protein